MDLRRLNAAMIVDASGAVVDANEGGRRWVGEDGRPLLGLGRMGGLTFTTSRWLEATVGERPCPRALLTVVPQPEGGALLSFAEDPEIQPASDTHLRAVLDSLPAMIGYWDRDLRNRFANKDYMAWFGISSSSDIYGRHISELLGEDIFAKNLPFIQGALRGEEQRFERELPRPDGKGIRHASAIYIPEIRGGEVLGFSVLVFDVSELKHAEAALRAAHDELEQRVEARTVALSQANRELERSNVELAQIARVISHDLQEPLRTVVNYSGLFRERYATHIDDRADRYIRYVSEGVTRAQAVVQSLVAVAQVGGELRPMVTVDLEAAARSALEGLRLRVEETSAEVIVAPMPPVLGDRQELTAVFQNLFANAMKYAGDRPPHVTVSASETDGCVEVSVTDRGMGIDPQYAEKVFLMFHRVHAKSQFEGSGVGLAIVKKIVERHGGTVGVRSSLGSGATFWFTLPKAERKR